MRRGSRLRAGSPARSRCRSGSIAPRLRCWRSRRQKARPTKLDWNNVPLSVPTPTFGRSGAALMARSSNAVARLLFESSRNPTIRSPGSPPRGCAAPTSAIVPAAPLASAGRLVPSSAILAEQSSRSRGNEPHVVLRGVDQQIRGATEEREAHPSRRRWARLVDRRCGGPQGAGP